MEKCYYGNKRKKKQKQSERKNEKDKKIETKFDDEKNGTDANKPKLSATK